MFAKIDWRLISRLAEISCSLEFKSVARCSTKWVGDLPDDVVFSVGFLFRTAKRKLLIQGEQQYNTQSQVTYPPPSYHLQVSLSKMVSFHLSTSVILSVVLAVILASEDDEKSIPFEDQQPYCAAMSAPKEQKFANCSRPEVASDCPCTCKKSCRTARKAIADERIVDCCAVNNIDPKCKHLCHYTADPAQVSWLVLINK